MRRTNGGRLRSAAVLAAGIGLLGVLVPTGAERQAGAGPSDRADARRAELEEAAVELTAAAEDAPEGTVTVIVDLAVELVDDREPTPAEEQSQAAQIADAQAAIAGELDALSDGAVIDALESTPTIVVEVGVDAIDALSEHPEVVGLHADRTVLPHLSSSTAASRADGAWSEGLDGTGTTVAVIDTGTDRTHPDFLRADGTNRVVEEACFSRTFTRNGSTFQGSCPFGQGAWFGLGASRPCSGDGCDHGTHVAGTVSSSLHFSPTAANPPGIAFGADLWTINVFGNPPGLQRTRASTADVLAALDYLYTYRDDHDLAAVNMSLGSGSYSATCNGEIGSEITQQLRAAGIAVVVAAGNDAEPHQVSWPACLPAATAVGATTDSGDVASFSNGGSMVDLLAPGVDVTAPVPGGGVVAKMGTSMAAPHVAGAFAVLRQQRPSSTVATLEQRLRDTGRSVVDSRNDLTFPLLDLDAAVLRTPSAPIALVAERGEDQIQVRWQPPATDGGMPIGEYLVYLDDVLVASVTGGLTQHTLAGLTPGDSHRIQVSAKSSVGEGPRTGALATSLRPGTPTFGDVGLQHPFFDEVEWMSASGISEGFADGTYRPAANVTRQAMSAFMQRLADGASFTPPASASFSDVGRSHPFFAEIEWMAAEGITTGFGDGTFRPGSAVTRQAMSAFVQRLGGRPPFEVPASARFADVGRSHPFFAEIEWMAAEGITTGFGDGTFRPGSAVTRQAMSAFMLRIVPHADEVGSILHHTGNLPLDGEGGPGAVGPDLQRFTALADATGRPVRSHADRLGTWGLQAYRCIVLNGNRGSLSVAQMDELDRYVRSGGTLISTAEAGDVVGGLASQAQQNRLLAHLGTSITNQGGVHDAGFRTTSSIVIDPLTAGVGAIRYGRTGLLEVSSPARRLFHTTTGLRPIAAAQALGDGEVIVLSDLNVLSDRSSTGYSSQDNGRFARNLCG